MQSAYAIKTRKLWLAVGLAASMFVVATVLAANQRYSAAEVSALRAIYDLPAAWSRPVYILTQLGSVWAAAAVVIGVLIVRGRKLAALLLANTVFAYILVLITKTLVARPRPAELLSDIVVRFEHASGYGFPSGHTAMATVMALTLMPYIGKKYRWLLVLWILIVGFSRIYLGVHAPLDVVGGFCIGVMVAGVARLVVLSRGRSHKSLKKSR